MREKRENGKCGEKRRPRRRRRSSSGSSRRGKEERQEETARVMRGIERKRDCYHPPMPSRVDPRASTNTDHRGRREGKIRTRRREYTYVSWKAKERWDECLSLRVIASAVYLSRGEQGGKRRHHGQGEGRMERYEEETQSFSNLIFRSMCSQLCGPSLTFSSVQSVSFPPGLCGMYQSLHPPF